MYKDSKLPTPPIFLLCKAWFVRKLKSTSVKPL